ncbi:MAG: nitrate reductase subunit beta, partial [Thiobacillus sp.]|nr:nitrate reductase subunit beta [Thiobacillus sp.]
ESKPGIGYPKNWEDQERWKGGWELRDGKLELKSGGRASKLLNIFANPDLPQIDDYYEPFTYNYARLQNAPLSEAAPTARPLSMITGDPMEKITWGPNWEDDLAGEFAKRSVDKNLENIQKDMLGQFENTFNLYLPRICNHCMNPACVAACPSGSLYKREEDGIVLVDQDKCRGWRMCISGCPYKKVYYNWKSGKAEKCIFCYPRIEAGQPTLCSESCVGRIRYLGVILYDADRIEEAASVADEKELYEAQLKIFLDPGDPAVIAAARAEGIAEAWLDAAVKSPVYKMAIDWKVAFPLHPEYRTLPMVWYVPPLSPIQAAAESGQMGMNGIIPDTRSLRIPIAYLANLLTGGKEKPIVVALDRLLAMRAYMRGKSVEGRPNTAALDQVGLTSAQADEMYRYLAIANYEDRFVIPTVHREETINTFEEKSSCGFSFGNGCSDGVSKPSLFGNRRNSVPVDLSQLHARKKTG